MSVQGIIFDLDGTLLDTLTDLAASGNRALAARGYPTHPVEAYKYFIGNGSIKLMQRAMPAELSDDLELAAAIRQEMLDDYKEHCTDTTKPYPGIRTLLAQLAELGIVMNILSNKPDRYTQLTVDQYFADVPLRNVFGARDEVPIKPDPAGALEIAELCSLEPADMLFVGDSEPDMQVGVNAEMIPVGVLWGYRTEDELYVNGARHCISSPEQLLELL